MCQGITTSVYKYFTSLFVYLFTYLLKSHMINTHFISGVKIFTRIVNPKCGSELLTPLRIIGLFGI